MNETTEDQHEPFSYPQPLPAGLAWYLCPIDGCAAHKWPLYQVGVWDAECGVVRCDCKYCGYCGDARRA